MRKAGRGFDLERVLAREEEVALSVPRELDGVRLDAALSRLMPYASRTYLASLAREGRVDVAGSRASPSSRVRAGQEILVRYVKRGRDDEAPLVPLPPVLLEDEQCLVLDKPTGLPVYPTSSHYRNTVLTLLHHHRPELAPSLFLCHRLDRDTSGVLLAAKGAERFRFFARQFFERTVEKRYLAVVARAPAREGFEVDVPVGGRCARTRFESLGRTAHGWCLAAFPEQGRRHQIRIHLAEAGLPILGDRVHGGAPFARLLLHAEELSFDHPMCGRVSVASPAPAEFERIANPQSL